MRFQNKFEDFNRRPQRRIRQKTEQVRSRKRDLGKRRGTATTVVTSSNASGAIKHLNGVTKRTSEPVLQIASRALFLVTSNDTSK